jgi:hypothetical protein
MSSTTVILLLVLTLLLVIAGPLITISALNLLFGLSIPINLFTWCSMLWLHWLFIVPKISSKTT